jgi:hypothetical protein
LRDDVPFAVRLRSLLKTALRRDRLRCKAVEDVPVWTDDGAGRSRNLDDPGAVKDKDV